VVETRTKTILYIEDDPASRVLVERTLKYAGYKVLVAENGLQGVDMARSEDPDLVLTDINLPDMSGREITTMLRQDRRFQDIPIVALTAQALDEQRELTMAAGISGYLVKPIDVEALPEQIERYLQGARDQIDAERMSRAQTRYAQEVVVRLEQRIRELESVNETLRHLDKMKDSFIQLTAHELRTPLTLIYGYSRLLEDSPALKQVLAQDESSRTLLRGLVEAIERMQGIINEILTVSRVMTNQVDMSVGPVDLEMAWRKVLADYELALQQRHLHIHFADNGWPVRLRADYDLLQLVLGNLLSNAIKYTPDDGHIYISARTSDSHVRISVRDTGIGVDVAEQADIFDRFHSAGDMLLHSTSKTAFRGGGLGLGLAVCRSVVEAHGGRIWVESQGLNPDMLPGSEFIVLLPLVATIPRQTG
jgi:signal transduction histidine kinase